MAAQQLGAVAGFRHRWGRSSLIGLVLLSSACAAPVPMPGTAPVTSRFAMGGVSTAEAGIRHYLAAGDSLALRSIAGLPGDTLLRLLHYGLAHHRLGHWQASNHALQQAEAIAEARYTKSLSQALGASVINDKTVDYNPPPHERAFMHYYGMLNYLQLGDRDAALVEARKANVFLERYTRENGDRSYESDAAVQYIAGMLQWARGDRDDAIVSLRKAGQAYDTYRSRYGLPSPKFVGADLARSASLLGIDEVAADVTKTYGLTKADIAPSKGSGELIVLIENGYIAHRIEQKLYVPILKSESDALSTGGVAAAVLVGLPIVDRTLTLFQETNKGNEYAKAYQDGYIIGAMITGGDVFSIAWPKYSLWANGAEQVTVAVGTARQEGLVINDLSAIAARHFEEEKGRIIRRAIFRGAGKFALAKFAEKKAEQAAAKGGGGWMSELAGMGAKAIVQGAGNALEQADTRSWSSLPAEIRAARFTLPPGDHPVTVKVLDADGTIRNIDLGVVKIASGETVVRTAFVDGSYRGSTQRFAMAQQGVDFNAGTAVASGALPAGSSASLAGGAAGAAGATGTAAQGMAGMAALIAGAAGGAAPGAASQSGAAAPATPAPVPAAKPAEPPPPPPPGALATVLAVRPVTSAIRPLAGETVRFAVQMRNSPERDRRERAQLALYVVRQGGDDTTLVWSGLEGDTASWDGMVGDSAAFTGWYAWNMRVTTPRGAYPTNYSWSTAVDVEAPNGRSLAQEPPEITPEPETRTVQRPDYAKKKSRLVWGLVFTGLGVGTSAAGYSMASTAIAGTPPGSAERQMAFNVWTGGVAIGAIGAIVAARGWFKDYTHDVREPDAGAVQRNQEKRLERAEALKAVIERNETVRQSYVMRIRTLPNRQGASPGRRP